MITRPSYSPLIVITGAGSSVPYELPDMKTFAQDFYDMLEEEGISKTTLALVRGILYRNSLDQQTSPDVDLEGLLAGLTSLSELPDSDNPAVSMLMTLAMGVYGDLSKGLTALLTSTGELTDLIPQPWSPISVNLTDDPAGSPGDTTLHYTNPDTNLVSLSPPEHSSVRFGGGLSITNTSEELWTQRQKVRQVAADARKGLTSWQGRIERLQEVATTVLNRVKTNLSVKYSRPHREKVESLFTPFFEVVADRSNGQVDLFTLNYDPSIEMFGVIKGVQIANGFRVNGPELVWDNNFDLTNERGIRLYKLHGSVNWYTYEGKIVQLTAAFGPTQVPTMTGSTAQNMLIYPTVIKPTWTEPYVVLFAHLAEAVKRAQCILVIGFSYRDEPVVSSLHQAQAINPDLKILHCGMTKEQAQELEQLQPLLGGMEFLDHLYGESGLIEELKQKLPYLA